MISEWLEMLFSNSWIQNGDPTSIATARFSTSTWRKRKDMLITQLTCISEFTMPSGTRKKYQLFNNSTLSKSQKIHESL